MKTEAQKAQQIAKSHTASNRQMTIVCGYHLGSTSILLSNSFFSVAEMVALTKFFFYSSLLPRCSASRQGSLTSYN